MKSTLHSTSCCDLMWLRLCFGHAHAHICTSSLACWQSKMETLSVLVEFYGSKRPEEATLQTLLYQVSVEFKKLDQAVVIVKLLVDYEDAGKPFILQRTRGIYSTLRSEYCN